MEFDQLCSAYYLRLPVLLTISAPVKVGDSKASCWLSFSQGIENLVLCPSFSLSPVLAAGLPVGQTPLIRLTMLYKNAKCGIGPAKERLRYDLLILPTVPYRKSNLAVKPGTSLRDLGCLLTRANFRTQSGRS